MFQEFEVVLTVRLSTNVSFDPIEGDPEPTASDAIENAIGRLPEVLFDGFGGEFEVALPIEGEAREI